MMQTTLTSYWASKMDNSITPRSFPKLQKLPQELQDMIWKKAAPEPKPRAIIFSLSYKKEWQLRDTPPCHKNIPIFKSLCHGSRYAVRAYTLHPFTVHISSKTGDKGTLPSEKHLWLNLETSTITLTRDLWMLEVLGRSFWLSGRPPQPGDPDSIIPAPLLPWDPNSSIPAHLQNLIIDIRLWGENDFGHRRWAFLSHVKSRKSLTFKYWTELSTDSECVEEARRLKSVIEETCKNMRSQDSSYILPEIGMCAELHPWEAYDMDVGGLKAWLYNRGLYQDVVWALPYALEQFVIKNGGFSDMMFSS